MTSLQSLYGSIHQCVKDIQEAAEPLEAVEALREESRRAVRVSRRIDVLLLDAEPYLTSGVQIWAALKEIDTALLQLLHVLVEAGRKGPLVLYLQADRILSSMTSIAAALDAALGRLQTQCCNPCAPPHAHPPHPNTSTPLPAAGTPSTCSRSSSGCGQPASAISLDPAQSAASALGSRSSSLCYPGPGSSYSNSSSGGYSSSARSADSGSSCGGAYSALGGGGCMQATGCPTSSSGSTAGAGLLPEETQEELAGLRSLLQRTRFELSQQHATNLGRYRQACDSLQAPFRTMLDACAHMLRQTLHADLMSKEAFFNAVAELQQEVELMQMADEADAAAGSCPGATTPRGSRGGSGPHAPRHANGPCPSSPGTAAAGGAGGGVGMGSPSGLPGAGRDRERDARYLRMMMDVVRVHHVECDTPLDFVCPLTHTPMKDPVLLHETGHSYERKALEEWWAKGHHFCPRTGVHLKRLNVSPNQNLRSAIDRWRLHNDMQLSFRPVLAAMVELQQHQEEQQKQQQQHSQHMELQGRAAMPAAKAPVPSTTAPAGEPGAASIQPLLPQGQGQVLQADALAEVLAPSSGLRPAAGYPVGISNLAGGHVPPNASDDVRQPGTPCGGLLDDAAVPADVEDAGVSSSDEGKGTSRSRSARSSLHESAGLAGRSGSRGEHDAQWELFVGELEGKGGLQGAGGGKGLVAAT